MTDPDTIYLEPPPGAPDTGRMWCEHDVWAADPAYVADGPAVKYVSARLVRELIRHARGAGVERLRGICGDG